MGLCWLRGRVSRFDRFQLARFSTWVEAGDPYIYKLDVQGIQRANMQGITTEHIAAFLQRNLGHIAIPAPIQKLLDNWQGPSAAGEVTIEQVLVIRTTSPEMMTRIFDTPEYRRFLGARLGPMACIIRSEQWEELRDALGADGIAVEVLD